MRGNQTSALSSAFYANLSFCKFSTISASHILLWTSSVFSQPNWHFVWHVFKVKCHDYVTRVLIGRWARRKDVPSPANGIARSLRRRQPNAYTSMTRSTVLCARSGAEKASGSRRPPSSRRRRLRRSDSFSGTSTCGKSTMAHSIPHSLTDDTWSSRRKTIPFRHRCLRSTGWQYFY